NGNADRTIAFVTWSTRTTRMGSQISRRRGGLAAACSSPGVTASIMSGAWLRTNLHPSVRVELQRIDTTVAQSSGRCLARHRRHVPPAPLALHAARALDRDAQAREARGIGWRPQLDVGHDKQHREVAVMGLE